MDASKLHWMWVAFSKVPPQDKAETALVAIASIAVVLWTGGFVSMQMQPNRARVRAVVGMDYLQFAFFGPLFSLFAGELAYRIIASILAIVYFLKAIDALRRGYISSTFVRMGLRSTSNGINVVESTSNFYYYGVWAVVGIAAYVVTAALPTQHVVAWTAAVAAVVGMQTVLSFLHSDES